MITYFTSISTTVWGTLASLFVLMTLLTILFSKIHKSKRNSFTEELCVRIRSWWFLMLIIATIVVAPSYLAVIILFYISFAAFREMISISKLKVSDRPAVFIAYVLIPVQFYFAYTNQLNWFQIMIPFSAITLFPIVLILSGYSGEMSRSLATISGVLLITVYSLSHIALLYTSTISISSIDGGGLILFFLLATEFNDIFQYNFGKAFGKRKILPKISPNKTWEGFLGGVVATTFLAGFMQFLTPLDIYQSFIVGLILAVFGFFGDAFLSTIKRDLKVKDTSDLIPGHGGIMDRMDSLVFNAPIFYYLLILFK